MKRRKEDRLIELAFGEADIKDLRRLGENESRFVDSYAEVRQSLDSLKEVPAHQLSNERLRHAILGKGLNQASEKPTSEFGWLWGSLAICGMVATLAVVMGRHSVRTSPALALTPPSSLEQTDFAFNDIPSTPKVAKIIEQHSYSRVSHYMVSESPTPERASKHRREKPPIREFNLDPSWLAANLGPGPDSDTESTESGSVSNAQVVVPQAAAPTPPQAPGEGSSAPGKLQPESLVEIGEGKDVDTGAHAAREIASKNVLVGG